MAIAERNKDEKILAALSYVWVLCIVILLLKKDLFVHRHAKQGLLIFIGENLVFIPVLGWIFGWIFTLIAFILAIVGFIKAMQGEEWVVPFIGEWWDKKIQL